ncbi:MAG: nitrilase-related carbon-nitrogen hydrolase, partial [Planctomycetota bacterium]
MMTVSLVQLATVIGDLGANLVAAERGIREAAAEEPDIVVLPEAWNLGFLPDDLSDAETAGAGPAHDLLGCLAAELGVHIVGGSIFCRDRGDVRNRCFVFDRRGERVATCDKQHPFAPMGEDQHVRAGEGAGPFELDGVPCGVLICYDLRFPEVARRLAFGGAKVLFVPAQWPEARLAAWRTLLRARAIEN